MRKKIDSMYLRGKIVCQNMLTSLRDEEKGASDMVAVIVLILIIIAVAATFRTELKKAITNVFTKFGTFLDNSSIEKL